MNKQLKGCDSCECAKTVEANGEWTFIGCFCPPYRGKWVAEIKDCPKNPEDEVKKNDPADPMQGVQE